MPWRTYGFPAHLKGLLTNKLQNRTSGGINASSVPVIRLGSSMQVRPIEGADVNSAIAIMQRGFPDPPNATWPEFFEHVKAKQARELVGPIGYLLRKDDRDVGIILTFRSQRTQANGTSVDVVNLSGWYIDEAYRWYAPMMLKKILKDKTAIFTDLTASEEVLKMLPAFKFKPWTEGVLMSSLPQSLSRYRRDVSIVRPEQSSTTTISDADMTLLRDHAALGCRTCILSVDGTHHPLVFATRWRRKIPHAYLIYAPDRQVVLSALGNVSAHLAKRGQFLIAMDCNENECVGAGQFRPTTWQKYYTGPVDAGGIDYAYSELVYMGCA